MLQRSNLRSSNFKPKEPHTYNLNDKNTIKSNLQDDIETMKGKVALVTSAANGIGYATAWELVKRGANVCIVDTDRKRGEEAATDIFKAYGPGRAVYCKGDVIDIYGMEAAFLSTIDLFSSLDIVVNTSGIINKKNLDKEIAVNINGIINVTELAFKYMSKEDEQHNGGVLINVASIYGLSSCAEAPIYAGTKHFAIGYSRSMGDPLNFNKSGIRVMAICPVINISEMSNELKNDCDSLPAQMPDFITKGIVHLIENGHTGSVWISGNGENPNFEVHFPDTYHLSKQEHCNALK